MQLASRPAVAARAVTKRSTVAPRPARLAVAVRTQKLVVRAESTETSTSTSTEASFDSEKVLKDLQAKWDAVDNKGAVIGYGAGAVVALWLSTVIVNAIGSVPLLPKLMELVGLGYSAWFTYRYLLFKSSREELLKDISDLSKKISGSE